MQMSKTKSTLLAGLMASTAMLMGANAFAANTAPSSKDAINKCVADAKAKGLKGDALKAAEKKCHEDAKVAK
jgi:hypothetical protein